MCTSPETRTPFTKEKLGKVIEILSTVGFVDQWGFSDKAMNPTSYLGGVLEWTDRTIGMRYLFTLNIKTGQVYDVRVIILEATYFKPKQVDVANEQLKALF